MLFIRSPGTQKRHYSQLFFACTYFTQFLMKINQIFNMCTGGLDAGKGVSDLHFMSQFKFDKM